MTSPADGREVASPVLQDAGDDSPFEAGEPTSPSYTPHQAGGDQSPVGAPPARVPDYVPPLDERSFEDQEAAQSALFEPSDDEMDVELTYTPADPAP